MNVNVYLAYRLFVVECRLKGEAGREGEAGIYTTPVDSVPEAPPSEFDVPRIVDDLVLIVSSQAPSS